MLYIYNFLAVQVAIPIDCLLVWSCWLVWQRFAPLMEWHTYVIWVVCVLSLLIKQCWARHLPPQLKAMHFCASCQICASCIQQWHDSGQKVVYVSVWSLGVIFEIPTDCCDAAYLNSSCAFLVVYWPMYMQVLCCILSLLNIWKCVCMCVHVYWSLLRFGTAYEIPLLPCGGCGWLGVYMGGCVYGCV